ncbi:bifunctional DNA primase/polymerase [Salinactinospora qingdaonensis]|uniref:Bifunctional DNA primase/polymerase n=1 Tax=Salinactinospora qingdaonensis TaxID=702744 RepID=A0ABP7F7R7_9ACTN
MADVLGRRKRRRQAAEGTLGTVLDYASLGWPVCRGAAPASRGSRACECDRIGCPAPGAHPVSPTWAMEATTDADTITRWWTDTPQANVILPTGRVFDVFDVPAGAGVMALARMGRAAVPAGPVAAVDAQRYLFFVATRGAPADEDEWWPCRLDCVPETIDETPGLRWHCRDSYVLAPPSPLPSGNQVAWIRPPRDGSGPLELPEPIAALDILSDACEEFMP